MLHRTKTKRKQGVVGGIIYGIIPHIFCIALVAFSAIGAVGAATTLKRIIVLPHFLETLLALSFIIATASAFLYLKKSACLCKSGLKRKWKYLTMLYSITIATNLIMFYFVVPIIANVNSQNVIEAKQSAKITLRMQIPCAGHALIIEDEFKKDSGVKNVSFKNPNIFIVSYDPIKTSPEKILALEICKEYKATIN